MIATRIRPSDCLFELFVDLCARARTIRPYDGDARQQWTEACRDLLRAVPDSAQRAAWAVVLADAFAPTMPGVPLEQIARMLLEWDA